MLHEKIGALAAHNFKEPLTETLALRWQDRCVEIRDAAQALLLAELSRIGPDGRKKLVETWASYLPNQDPFVQPAVTTLHHPNATMSNTSSSNSLAAPSVNQQSSSPQAASPNREEEEEEEDEEHEPSLKPSPAEYKRKQTTAIILLGVLGAEFGEELTGTGKEARKGVEGFSIGNSNLARLTSTLLIGYFSGL